MTHLPHDSNGKLSAYAWPGGYPLFYVDKQASVLCPACANKEVDQSQEVVGCDVNWEDAGLYCGDCSERIESAYAEDETQQDKA